MNACHPSIFFLLAAYLEVSQQKALYNTVQAEHALCRKKIVGGLYARDLQVASLGLLRPHHQIQSNRAGLWPARKEQVRNLNRMP